MKNTTQIGQELAVIHLEREKIKNKILRTKLGLLREELKFVKKENKSI